MNTIAAIILGAVTAALVTAVLGFAVIPWLHKLKFGQTILDIGPKWHEKKQGTPTMGGIMFIIGVVVAAAVTLITDKVMGGDILAQGLTVKSELYTKFFSGLLFALGVALIGFADDYIKVVKKRNLGLTEKQKTILQAVVILSYLLSLYLGMSQNPYMFIPFVGNIEMGIFFWIFGFVVIYGAINAVNFTDGIDGLCSSVTITCGVSLCAIAYMHKLFGISLMASLLIGGCIGFLFWNRNPAKVFMGDTGSMFLGGMVVATSYALNCPIILLLSGIVYVIEGASDVLQIGYYKLTHGKRIFKMAPIHHHFEMCGWKEKKIVAVFSIVNAIGGAAAVAIMYFGGYAL
ncbi:MAG: phospho-N-acetylmuramoyl-pentapeptide-transferase [Clostridia bacterium]|nr:phospho-N-acetylmuramoyl-pentapeptide-transferase [Clostridia bacterium]MBQ7047215.1 phospho-N-acetylmuramoyl-pentapeptide-transferase [Oscillospiraceae bacterium]